MRVALVHDHLAQLGGAEKTLQSFAEMFPQAPLYTLLYKQEYADSFFYGRAIVPSFLQRLPLGVRKYQWYMPLMPAAVESFDVSGFDLVISSASSFAKGVIVQPQALHICYCHTPTRYLWHYANQYMDELHLPAVMKKVIHTHLSRIRQWDFNAAQRVDYFIANSKTTQARIQKYYLRDSTVIYPPVATESFSIAPQTERYFLCGGRLTPYKRFDLAIAAFNKLGLPLVIFGDGPDKKRLQKLAGPNVYLTGAISEAQKNNYFARCRAFIHPQEEDFGITQVEAQAAGRPVICYAKGGALETVIHGLTGVLFYEQTWECLADAVLRFMHTTEFNFDPQRIKAHAEQFSEQRFQREITEYMNSLLLYEDRI